MLKHELRAIFVLLIVIGLVPFHMGDSSAAAYRMDADLGNVDASFIGKAGGDNFGSSVAIVGDVNGDGFDDILIGAPYNDDGAANGGATYLMFGKVSGWSMDTKLSEADASFVGESQDDMTGIRIASAGDVNGDGFDDFLIGSSRNSEAHWHAGQTYLVFGRASGWSLNTDLSNANASFLGEKANDDTGFVAGVGDVNGDGYDDFMIGALRNDEAGDDAGQTYLIFGRSSGWSMDTDLSNANASFLGEKANDRAHWVAGAGDVNGDGYDDILIGAHYKYTGVQYGGVSYLIFGKATGWSMDTDLSNANASFLGKTSWGFTGSSCTGVGDVNGDGYDDFIIDDNHNNEWGSDSGQPFLFLGKATGWSMGTLLSNADASFYGEAANDVAGAGIAGAGDVNADGLDDFIIGAIGNAEGGDRAGQTYVILGRKTGWSMDTNLSMADASFIGEGAVDFSSRGLSCAGDVNADGYDDILIGAANNNEGGGDAGQTYLIFFEQPDTDNDGVFDVKDAFPTNPYEYVDTDLDGMGDNLDPDADNDGTPDEWDAFPLDKNETKDTDLDGIGDNKDTDDDNDGINDTVDLFPQNPSEYMDTDLDGIGNNMDDDDDGDGEPDWRDAFPLDKNETKDTDNDGIGNKADPDDDNDGIIDVLDRFPWKSTEHLDTDNDGLGNNMDNDDDNDGVLDIVDAFPLNVTEWTDTDGDGYGDNIDLDDDADGVQDSLDAFPKNPFEFIDSDGDGIGDAMDPDDDNDGVPDHLELAQALDQRLSMILSSINRSSDELSDSLTGVNMTLQGSLSDLEAGFLGELRDVNSSLASDIRAMLDRITGDISTMNSSVSDELGSMLTTIRSDTDALEEWLDIVLEALRAEVIGIQGEIEDFEESTELNLTEIDADLTDIDTTLLDLGKLNSILDDLEQLDLALESARVELDSTVKDANEEQIAKSNVNMLLVILVLVLVIVITVILLMIRRTGLGPQESKIVDNDDASEP
jgi:hypothetical protein